MSHKIDSTEYAEYRESILDGFYDRYAVAYIRTATKMLDPYLIDCYLNARDPAEVARQIMAKFPVVPECSNGAPQPDFSATPPGVVMGETPKKWYERFIR